MKIYTNKHIVIVNVKRNELAEKVKEVMKELGFANVTVIDAPESYPGYYKLAAEHGDYNMFIEEKDKCSVKMCKVEGMLTDRLKHEVSRDTEEASKAKMMFKHHLKMLELKPDFLGAFEIPFNEVKDIEWYYKDATPLIKVTAPNVEGCPEAIANAVIDYFNSVFKD